MTEVFRQILSETYFQTAYEPNQSIPARTYAMLHLALEINPDYQVEVITVAGVSNRDNPKFYLPSVYASASNPKRFIPLKTLLLLAKNSDSLTEVADYYNQHKPEYSHALTGGFLNMIQESLETFLNQQSA